MHWQLDLLPRRIFQAYALCPRALGVRFYMPKLPSLPPIDESDLEETFVRGSGPGGA